MKLMKKIVGVICRPTKMAMQSESVLRVPMESNAPIIIAIVRLMK
jgi:hypothetical protein